MKPSAQVVWPIFGQEILNGDVGAGFNGIQITSGLFHMWRAWGITSETQLMALAIGALVMAGLMLNAGVSTTTRLRQSWSGSRTLSRC